MHEHDTSVPPVPFLETWGFRIKILSNTEPEAFCCPRDIRKRACDAIAQKNCRDDSASKAQDSSTEYHEEFEGNPIRDAVKEIVADGLSHPDYEYFITEYQEGPGSWEITFYVIGAFYGGVCGYGAFRQGLEYVASDLSSLFRDAEGITARVSRRYRRRRELRPRDDSFLDRGEEGTRNKRKRRKRHRG